MITKKCGKCGNVAVHYLDSRWCVDCRKEYARKYEENRDAYMDTPEFKAKAKIPLTKMAREYNKTHPIVDVSLLYEGLCRMGEL